MTDQTPNPITQLEFFGARSTDPETSQAAGEAVRVRAGTQQAKLLAAFAAATVGLTDEQAGMISGLSALPGCCYWKRCSELRALGLIEVIEGQTRESRAGQKQRVSRITERGRALNVRLRAPKEYKSKGQEENENVPEL